MKLIVTRGLVVAGWLLTPVMAWAVSFLGGWLGAGLGSIGTLGAGAAIGAVAGAAGWVLVMRAILRRANHQV